MPTVYVPHKPNAGFNYDKAEALGKVKIIFDGNVLTHNHKVVETVLRMGLQDFKAEDFLLLSGSHFILALALAYLLGRLGSIKILQYSGKTDSYDVYELDLDMGK